MAACLLLACGDDSGTAPTADAGAEAAAPLPCSTLDPGLIGADPEALFGSATVPVFDLALPASSWEWLKEHARDEEYVPAEACFEGRAIGTVGLRFKGSYGSLYTCFDAAGKNTCRKLGMKLKFDEYVPGQRFHRLKRLNFQGYRWDDSYLKERLSYDLYRAMGIVTPRAAWALVRVNGEPQGLFGMVEQIDGVFTKHRFPGNGENNLYKEAWPGQTDDAWLTAHLATNKDVPSIAALQAFSTALVAAPEAALRPTLAAYMDLAYLARYMAVDDAIANFDGVITYYTSGSPDEAGNHNFYLYEESPQRFTLIPWDLESTFSMSSNYGFIPSWHAPPADCTLTYPVWSGSNQVIAPGCDRVFRALAADLGEYRAAVRELLDTHFTEASQGASIDALAAFIRPAAIADPHGPGEQNFDNAVGFIKQDLPRLRARLAHLASGAPTIPLALAATGVNDFEGLDDYGLIAGGSQMSNGHTTTSVAINATEPLGGAQSCRVSFDFGNEAKSWQQWLWYRMPFAVQPLDLNQRVGVRFQARSNVARTLRVNIDSPAHSAANEGIQFGWEIPVGPTARTIELRFANAGIPSWAVDPGDALPAILSSAAAFQFQPMCVGRDGTGQLPPGVTDRGWLDLDDVELF